MNLPLPVNGTPDLLMNPILGLGDGAYFQYQPQHMNMIDQHQLLDHSSINQEKCDGIPQSVVCSESLAFELAKRRVEMDWLLQLENQRLRTVVQDKTRQEAVLLQRYESKIMSLVRQKEKDLEIARNRTMELQNFLVMAEVEAQEWQRKATDNEAIVIGLNNRLEQVRGFDVESLCESSNKVCRNEEDQQVKKIACKRCKARSMSIVFLPCRHLCSCTACESLLEVCPVCESVKDGSIEVFFD